MKHLSLAGSLAAICLAFIPARFVGRVTGEHGAIMGPVSFTFLNQSIAAGATALPLDGWQYEFAPANGALEVIANAAAVGCVMQISAGGDTIQEESPVPAGGTAGVAPTAFNAPVIVGRVRKGDRMKIRIRNTTGGAVVVNVVATFVPGR